MLETSCCIRKLVGSMVALALLVSLTEQRALAQPSARRPNIVVLLADDLGYADIGVHGGKEIPTPHIDSIARGGVRCTNGYVSGPYCSPTRAALLTGRYQQRYGNEFNTPGGAAAAEHGLATGEVTLADRLQAAGYATALLGKWHLGSGDKFHPQQRGFDEFFGFLEGQHTYWNHAAPTLLRGSQPVREPLYLTDALAREAVQFIDQHQDQPFFLLLSFNAVHTPMEADDARLMKFASIQDPQRRTYAAMLSAMDDAIGNVLGKLERQQLTEQTLVIFLSDNGGPTMTGTTINGSSNLPLRGGKRTTLEGGIRVPFLLQWPGKLPAGTTYDHPVIQLDLHSTALAAADIPAEPGWHLDGVNLLPYVNGSLTDAPHAALYWRLGAQRAVRCGEWKLVRYDLTIDGESSDPDGGTRVSADRLYHLGDDLGETRDLAGEQPAKARELSALWKDWNAELPAP